MLTIASFVELLYRECVLSGGGEVGLMTNCLLGPASMKKKGDLTLPNASRLPAEGTS